MNQKLIIKQKTSVFVKHKQSTFQKQFFTNISLNAFFFNILVKFIIISKKFTWVTFENYFQTIIYVYHDVIHNTDLLE